MRSSASEAPSGVNLIANPSFEFGLDGWRADGEANARLQWRVETEGAAHAVQLCAPRSRPAAAS